jgi:hypothetical protein
MVFNTLPSIDIFRTASFYNEMLNLEYNQTQVKIKIGK